jgi:hypothetical protein
MGALLNIFKGKAAVGIAEKTVLAEMVTAVEGRFFLRYLAAGLAVGLVVVVYYNVSQPKK